MNQPNASRGLDDETREHLALERELRRKMSDLTPDEIVAFERHRAAHKRMVIGEST